MFPQSKLHKCETQVVAENNLITELKATLADKNSEIQALKNQVNQKEVHQIETKLNQLKSTNEDLQIDMIIKDSLIADLRKEIDHLKKPSTSGNLSSKQKLQNDTLQAELKKIKAKLQQSQKAYTKQCKTLTSRNNEIAMFKQEVLRLSDNNADLDAVKSQVSAKDKALTVLRKQIEDQKKKIDSQASTQAGLNKKVQSLTSKQKVLEKYKKHAESAEKTAQERDLKHKNEIQRLNRRLQETLEEKKKSDALLEMALTGDEDDVVSIHLVAELYELYKAKLDLLEHTMEKTVFVP